MAAHGQPGDMRSVAVAMDRGYWTSGLLHNQVMRSGARIMAGTVRRQPCMPFTFGQKLDDQDTRTDVPKSGPKALFIKECVSHGRKLYSFAYKNGYGGVILGILTEIGMLPEFELVLHNPRDLVWYKDSNLSDLDCLKKSFQLLRLDFSDKENKSIYRE